MKFSIRDLLFVTVLVAMGVAWWLDHRVQTEKFKAKEKERNEILMRVEYMTAREAFKAAQEESERVVENASKSLQRQQAEVDARAEILNHSLPLSELLADPMVPAAPADSPSR